MPRSSREAKALDLITTQINFGLAYAREAHTAYEASNGEYGDLARGIAMDAYSSATRQAARLLDETHPALADHLAKLEAEIDGLWQADAMAASRSIA